MNERVIELVNGELDGTNTAEETTELTQLLDQDEVARAYFQESEVFFGTLNSVAEVEPPPGLKDRIMESIAAEPVAAGAPSHGFIESLKDLARPLLQRPAWAVSYAFAAGLIVGIGALLVTRPAPTPPEVVQGTIGSVNATVIDEARLEVADLVVDLATSHLQDEPVLDIKVSGSGEAIIRVGAPGSGQVSTISASGTSHVIFGLDHSREIEIQVSAYGEEASTRLVSPGSGSRDRNE